MTPTVDSQSASLLFGADQFLRQVIDSAQDGMAVFDTQLRCLMWNSSMVRMTDLSHAQAQGKTPVAIGREFGTSEFSHALCRVLAGEQVVPLEWQLRGQEPESPLRILQIHFWPLKEGEKIAGVICNCRAVTANRLAEAELQASQARYRSLAEVSQDMIFIIDRDNRVEYVNTFAARQFHLRPEDFIGKPSSEFFPPEIAAGQGLLVGKVLATGEALYTEDQYAFPHGTLWLGTWLVPIKNAQGTAVSVLGTARDVTARLETEQAIRRSEQMFRVVWENCPEGIGIVTLEDQRFVDVNESLLALLGYRREEIIGRTAAEIGMWTYPEQQSGMIQAVRTHSALKNIEASLLDRAGQTHDVLVSGESIQVELELCLVLIVHDVSDRKRLESQLRQSQKMESIGSLVGGISHDFNNLLTVIQGYANLALLENPVQPQITESLQQIFDTADRAAKLVRQLLTFSRKQPMQAQSLDLNEVVSSLARMLRRVIGEQIALECEHTCNLPLIKADMGMMEQVVMNMVINARDAMPQGGRLIIATDVENISLAENPLRPQARPGTFVCLSIKDTGHGIDPELLPRIFEPFFTTKEASKGTGLGLATVHGIVQQHQGWIEVQSAPGQGTIFRVFLPAHAGELRRPEHRVLSTVAQGGNETILIVEDELDLRSLSRIILEQFGYCVLEAENGVDALELWRQHGAKISLVLTDVIMPQGMNGYQLAELLRQERPDLCIIFSSGYSSDVGERDLSSIPRSCFLQKPYPPLSLVQLVRHCLDHPGEPHQCDAP
jgi:PAS domain S-box-containing protein